MADEQKAKLRLEIAHVLFLDIVGYSKRTTEEQAEALPDLNRMVRGTEAAGEAEAAAQLIILPTGDGMALVFTGSVEEPVECALQISQELRARPSLPVRMGIHSGPVHHVADVNERANIAGAGINLAQRGMDCGDAGQFWFPSGWRMTWRTTDGGSRIARPPGMRSEAWGASAPV